MHVAHRLDRHGAGRRMDFDTAAPDVIAEVITEEIGRSVTYREAETYGARGARRRSALSSSGLLAANDGRRGR